MLDELKLGLTLGKLYLKERPYIQKLKELSKMKLSTNAATQVIGTIGQAINTASGLVPTKYQFWVSAVLGLLQLVSGVLAHFSNPDGTPASVPYTK